MIISKFFKSHYRESNIILAKGKQVRESRVMYQISFQMSSILYRTHDQIVSISRLIDALKNHAMQLESICHIIVSLVKNHLENYWYTRVN